jgi:hypothetical protein
VWPMSVCSGARGTSTALAAGPGAAAAPRTFATFAFAAMTKGTWGTPVAESMGIPSAYLKDGRDGKAVCAVCAAGSVWWPRRSRPPPPSSSCSLARPGHRALYHYHSGGSSSSGSSSDGR